MSNEVRARQDEQRSPTGRFLPAGLRVALAVLMLATAGGAAADSLIKPLGAVKETGRHALRRANVQVDIRQLINESGRGAEALSIALFPDEDPVEVRFGRVDWRAENSFTWFGYVANDPQSLVVLTVVDGYLSGTILHGERMFRIKPSDSDSHQVVEVDRRSFPDLEPIGVAGESQFDSADKYDTNPPFEHHEPPVLYNRYRIDLMAAFTEPVLYAYGGSVHTEIQHNVDMANVIFHASGAATHLNLVHTETEFYDEQGLTTNQVIGHMRTKNDGFLDAIFVERDAHKADIVMLFASWDEECGDSTGFAGQASGVQSETSQWAFAVVDIDCGVANGFVFTHEIGHLLGADHDVGAQNPPQSPTPYARGMVVPETNVRTVMTYGTACPDCFVSPYFSTPYKTTTLGWGHPELPLGSASSAHNARRVNELTPHVSSFR